jgi:hypothetical protein
MFSVPIWLATCDPTLLIRPDNRVEVSHPFRKEGGMDGAPKPNIIIENAQSTVSVKVMGCATPLAVTVTMIG